MLSSNSEFYKELIKIIEKYEGLKKVKDRNVKNFSEELTGLISIINNAAKKYGKEWLYFTAADIFEDIYEGFNEVSAKYLYLAMSYVLRVFEGLIIAWFEDSKGFFKENINPILLADTIDRLMYAVKGLENFETYNILGGLFKKLVENLNRETYRKTWNNFWERARSYYLRSLSINANNYEAYEGLGDLYLLLEDYKKALNYYTNAVLLNKSEGRLWIKLAWVFEKIGDIDKAIEVLEESLKHGVMREAVKKLIELYRRKGVKEKVETLNRLLKEN